MKPDSDENDTLIALKNTASAVFCTKINECSTAVYDGSVTDSRVGF